MKIFCRYFVLLLACTSLHLPHLAHAQSDPDEAFDPFSDYSEFDEASDEEADLNFFKNGRFFTLGIAAGLRGFTDNFAKNYGQGATYGFLITYFFDLRTAFTLGYLIGDHAVNFGTNLDTYTGTVSITMIPMDLKYYFNTQNVTKGLADLNPYLLFGFTQYYRKYSISKVDGLTGDSTMGLDLGAGMEFPIMKKRSFIGIQGAYHLVNFADEGKDFLQGTEKLNNRLSGDIYDFLVILGWNF